MPVYGVHVFKTETEHELVKTFTKQQEAHSFLVFCARSRQHDFYKIVVTSNADVGRVLEVMKGKLSR